MKLKSKNYSLVRIDGTKPKSIEQAYQFYFNRWKFNNSDKIWLDNELISKDEKNLIIESNYNIKPKSISIITSDIEDKIPLTEDLFINEQIRLFKRIKAQTKGIEIDRVLYSKSKFYLKYLKKRLVEIKKTSTTGTLNRFNNEKYLHFGSLVARGLIQKKDFSFWYNDKEYSSARELGRELNCPHQYINDTFNGNGNKSIYSKVRYNKIIAYCKVKNYNVLDSFK